MASPTAGSAAFSPSLLSLLLVWCGPWPNPPPTLRALLFSLSLPSPFPFSLPRFLPPSASADWCGWSGQLPRRPSRLARLLSGWARPGIMPSLPSSDRAPRGWSKGLGHRVPTACSIGGPRLSRMMARPGDLHGCRRHHPWPTSACGLAGPHCRPRSYWVAQLGELIITCYWHADFLPMRSFARSSRWWHVRRRAASWWCGPAPGLTLPSSFSLSWIPGYLVGPRGPGHASA